MAEFWKLADGARSHFKTAGFQALTHSSDSYRIGLSGRRAICRYTETMCGIAGFVSTAPASGCEATLARMTDAIRHRGPDDSGAYHDEWAHLGHRRLSIIDVAGGHQPMANETRTHWITYNGEIFNHADLRPALEQAGHRYATRSDTETILHAYEQHGPDSRAAFPRACSPSPSGTIGGAASSARATAWASSPSIISGTVSCSRLPPRSRRCSSIPPFRPRLKRRWFPRSWRSAIRAEIARCFATSTS